MTPGRRILILSGLLAAALACYFVGMVSGALIFLAAGAIFEISFWVKLFRRRS